MSTWRLLKAVSSKKAEQVKAGWKKKSNKEKQASIEGNLPLGLHINGRVKLDTSPFILYGEQVKLDFPSTGYDILAVGKLSLDPINPTWRFYLQSTDGKSQAMLQIAAKQSGEVIECRYFQSLDQIFPQDSEDWGFWLDSEDGAIGWIGFETPDGTEYGRAWDEQAGEHVQPLDFEELIYSAETVTKTEHQAMLYGRWLDRETEDVAEYLLVSAESDDQDAMIHIMVGLEINPMGIEVLY